MPPVKLGKKECGKTRSSTTDTDKTNGIRSCWRAFFRGSTIAPHKVTHRHTRTKCVQFLIVQMHMSLFVPFRLRVYRFPSTTHYNQVCTQRGTNNCLAMVVDRAASSVVALARAKRQANLKPCSINQATQTSAREISMSLVTTSIVNTANNLFCRSSKHTRKPK